MRLHPDFFCVAAQKTGTSWLYDQARSHPGIWMPPIKELRYFNAGFGGLKERAKKLSASRKSEGGRSLDKRDRDFLQHASALHGESETADLQQYAALFGPAGNLVTGDVSPANHRLEEAAIARLAAGLPECKFLLMLREPIGRLWSQINMQVRSGKSSAEALTDAGKFEKLVRHPLFVDHSFQSKAIRRWRDIVGKNRFRVFVMDDLIADPAGYRSSVFSYIGLRAEECRIAADYNKKAGNEKTPLPDEFRDLLSNYFAEEYDALERLVESKWIPVWRARSKRKHVASISASRIDQSKGKIEPDASTNSPDQSAPNLIDQPVRLRAKERGHRGRKRAAASAQEAKRPGNWQFPIQYEPAIHERRVVRFFKKHGTGELELPWQPIPSAFICFTNRTGSNFLAELLANTGKLPRAGEWFNWPHVISFSERMGAKSFPHFCQLLAKNTSKQGHFVGKIGLSQLYLLSRMRAIPDVFASPHMIFVRRRDVLAQAISYVIAEQTGEWKHHAARKRQVATSRTPTYDGAAIARNIRGITGTNAGFEEFFANFDFPVMEVVYEDLVAEESDKISAITEWLGLGPTAIEREAVTLKRQRNSVNDEWRERFLSERMTYFARATDEQIAKLVRLS